MPVLIRSQARSMHPLAHHHSPALAPLSWSQPSQQPSLKGDVNCSHRLFGGCPSTLALGHERYPAIHTCIGDCLTCPVLIHENQFVCSTTDRKYFTTDIKPDEIHCKLQNCIYLLTCTHWGIQDIGECITPLNLRMNIHRR